MTQNCFFRRIRKIKHNWKSEKKCKVKRRKAKRAEIERQKIRKNKQNNGEEILKWEREENLDLEKSKRENVRSKVKLRNVWKKNKKRSKMKNYKRKPKEKWLMRHKTRQKRIETKKEVVIGNGKRRKVVKWEKEMKDKGDRETEREREREREKERKQKNEIDI